MSETVMSQEIVSEPSSEPKPDMSTAQNSEKSQVGPVPHLLAIPKIILTRIDDGKLPIPLSTGPASKKPVKNKKSKPVLPKPQAIKLVSIIKHGTRGRGRPKKDYNFLAKVGRSELEETDNKKVAKKSTGTGKIKSTNKITGVGKIGSTGKISRVGKITSAGKMKSAAKITDNLKKSSKESKQNSVTAKGKLKKTMLQKRSKIAIPMAKKPKLTPIKTVKTNSSTPKSNASTPKANYSTPKANASSLKANASTPKINTNKYTPNTTASTSKAIAPMSKPKKPILPKTTVVHTTKPTTILPLINAIDTDMSDDEFLYDELIEELENSHPKRAAIVEKTTNITLKPNVGNKPPTIVKGGIVKKTNLPADLKAVTSPATLNSSKLSVISLTPQSKIAPALSTTKKPIPPANHNTGSPNKASPWPISISSPVTKGVGKKGQKRPASDTIEELFQNVTAPKSAIKEPKIPAKEKSMGKLITPVSKPKAKPKIGPKKVVMNYPITNTTTEDESDEYTEVETLENYDSEAKELSSNLVTNTAEKENTEVVKNPSISDTNPEAEAANSSNKKFKDNEDPNLDLLRILSDDTEDEAQPTESEEIISLDVKESQSIYDISKSNNIDHSISNGHEQADEIVLDDSTGQVGHSSAQSVEISKIASAEEPVEEHSHSSEPSEKIAEEPGRVRTVYDLISDVSLQYPSWNLHIIPETNAFCIAQVTKGRLGLPTLKKCIELDAETYSAKVYIHQYHIKRFDGVYDSEEAILALIEEIHSIKA